MTTKPNENMVSGSLLSFTKGFTIDGPTTGSYQLYLKIPYDCTLKSINYTISSGNTDVTLDVDGTNLSSPYAAIDVSSSSIVTATSDVDIDSGSSVGITFSNSSSAGLVELELVLELR